MKTWLRLHIIDIHVIQTKKNPTASILFQISNSWISISLKSVKKAKPSNYPLSTFITFLK